MGKPCFADRRVKLFRQFGKRHFGVLHPQAGSLLQWFGQGFQRAGLFQHLNRKAHLHGCLYGFAHVGGFAVGKAVGFIAHIVIHALFHDAHGGVARAHKGQQIFQMVAGFDIYGVGPLAHGAVGIELILGQNALQLLRKRVPGRKELNVIFLFRVGCRTAT